jgi:hypothetical protein
MPDFKEELYFLGPQHLLPISIIKSSIAGTLVNLDPQLTSNVLHSLLQLQYMWPRLHAYTLLLTR